MGKRNNNKGNQKKAGNASNNYTELASTQETPVKETPAEGTPSRETTVMDNPMELIQKLQTCFQSQETDSNTMRSEIQRLENALKDTQNTLKNAREQSQVDISELNLVIEDLESNSENLRRDLRKKNRAFTMFEKQYTENNVAYTAAMKEYEKDNDELEEKIVELKSLIQTRRIATEEMQQNFVRERSNYIHYMDSLNKIIIELEDEKMSRDIEIPEPINADGLILRTPIDRANLERGSFVLLPDQVEDIDAFLAKLPTQNKFGILETFYMRTDNDVKGFGSNFTPIQAQRKEHWEESLVEMVRERLSRQHYLEHSLEYKVLVKNWQTAYSYLDTLDMAQVLYCDYQYQMKVIDKKDECITRLRNELSMQKIETTNCQEKLIASHDKVIDGMREEAKIKRTEEQIKQNRLKGAHQKAIDSLNAKHEAQITKIEAEIFALNKSCESQVTKAKTDIDASCENRIVELEKEHLPYRDLAERVLAREFEWCKHPRARNEETIDQGNLAAHGGNCRAVLRRTELSPSDEDAEWFTHWYGVSIETFAKHKDSPRIQKLVDMRYEMKKFKTVQLSETAFERKFQEIMRAVEAIEECQLPASSQSHIDEGQTIESTSDPFFWSMCTEYSGAAEHEKMRRKSDWKLGRNGQNMGDSIVDRTSY
ncbi:hypothetical protein EAE96_008095 [Botrytis aclada]|nr:hypothetical protein EAE96_008095 [Botrytis aclada]